MANSALKSSDNNVDSHLPAKDVPEGPQWSADVRYPALRDLERLEEDPVIRPMLVGAGVPRHLWPEGPITNEVALALIQTHQAKEGTA